MKELTYTDAVFGTHTIKEPVIIDVILSPSLQRLRHIDQAGYPGPFFPGLDKHSRFDHSMGVFLLLRKYGASLEEQIAGLIHDVSHSAFSHCADYSLADAEAGKTQTHQDSIFASFVRKSEIPRILSSYGIDINIVLDETRFPLKEQPLPNLCADRIDYSLRAAVITHVQSLEQIKELLHHLQAKDGKWFFTNVHSAQAFAELFSHLNATQWCSVHSAAMFRTVGDCLRYSLQQRYLCSDDFYKTDRFVLEKIENHSSKDPHLKMLYDRMNGIIPYINDPLQEQEIVHCKSRVVDPLCLHNNRLHRLSDVVASWGTRLKEESSPRSYFLKFG